MNSQEKTPQEKTPQKSPVEKTPHPILGLVEKISIEFSFFSLVFFIEFIATAFV